MAAIQADARDAAAQPVRENGAVAPDAARSIAGSAIDVVSAGRTAAGRFVILPAVRAPRFLVVDDLTIADVAEDEVANSVVVTVVKHSGRSHQIRFFHPDALRRAHWVHALHAWRLAGTALTYVRTPRDGTLVDAAARFQACFAG